MERAWNRWRAGTEVKGDSAQEKVAVFRAVFTSFEVEFEQDNAEVVTVSDVRS